MPGAFVALGQSWLIWIHAMLLFEPAGWRAPLRPGRRVSIELAKHYRQNARPVPEAIPGEGEENAAPTRGGLGNQGPTSAGTHARLACGGTVMRQGSSTSGRPTIFCAAVGHGRHHAHRGPYDLGHRFGPRNSARRPQRPRRAATLLPIAPPTSTTARGYLATL